MLRNPASRPSIQGSAPPTILQVNTVQPARERADVPFSFAENHRHAASPSPQVKQVQGPLTQGTNAFTSCPQEGSSERAQKVGQEPPPNLGL